MDSAFPDKNQLDAAIAGLVDASKSYSDAPDLGGYASRVEIITRAKSLIRTLVSPDMMPNYHGLNVRPLCLVSLASGTCLLASRLSSEE